MSAQLVLAICVPIFVLAASLSRIYAANGRLILLIIALILFTIGNTLMVRVMREMGLGVAISIATISQFVLINLIAVGIFQERPSTAQLAGIALGAAGMVLILLPRGSP